MSLILIKPTYATCGLSAYVQKSIRLLLVLLIMLVSIPVVHAADCSVNDKTLYKIFKDYRQTINTTNQLKDLTRYFSKNFNTYFSYKMKTADTKAAYHTFLSQYWSNLNTAKDIVIVYKYSAVCHNGDANLTLITVLRPDTNLVNRKVDVWRVIVNYVNEQNEWKIDSFDYDKLKRRKIYSETDIKDNFVNIR